MVNSTTLTFNLNRKCLYCQTAIADQVHGLRNFCEPFYREDGSIQNCKDLHHSALLKAEMEPFRQLAYMHRDISKKIEDLLAKKGNLVSVEDINQFGIPLECQLRLERNSSFSIFYFKFYAFQQISKTQFKIFSHELL